MVNLTLPCNNKQYNFNFDITNFPFLSSNIPFLLAYGVFISQLIGYAWTCPSGSYECFILRVGNFPVNYSNRDTSWNTWNRHSDNFCGRYGDLIKQYEVSFSETFNDILQLDQLQWLLIWSDFSPFLWFSYRAWPLPNCQWFPWSICKGCGMPAGNAYPSGTWFCPFLGLAYAAIVETSFLKLAVTFPTFHLGYPLVLSQFCFNNISTI